MVTDAFGNPIPVDAPRALTVLEIARLRALGVEPRTGCATRHYQFCCNCDACQARAQHAERYGYDPRGRLNPKPQPRQPWERAA